MTQTRPAIVEDELDELAKVVVANGFSVLSVTEEVQREAYHLVPLIPKRVYQLRPLVVDESRQALEVNPDTAKAEVNPFPQRTHLPRMETLRILMHHVLGGPPVLGICRVVAEVDASTSEVPDELVPVVQVDGVVRAGFHPGEAVTAENLLVEVRLAEVLLAKADGPQGPGHVGEYVDSAPVEVIVELLGDKVADEHLVTDHRGLVGLDPEAAATPSWVTMAPPSPGNSVEVPR